jgi:hypothetical protein
MGGRLIRRRQSARILLASAAAVSLVVAAGCGSAPATGVSTSLAPGATATAAPEPAGPTPSTSAKLICSEEVQKDLAYTLGEQPIAPVDPTWSNHVYACQYRYSSGVIALSVKELSSQAETTAYYQGLASRLGDDGSLANLGQGAFVTRDGSVVVRKDWRVLLVDISGLPREFGIPQTSAADVAVTVADVVIACWTGD